MSKAGSPGMKHRFARALLRSSCTTTATTTAADLIKLSTGAPPRQEPESRTRCRSDRRRCAHRIAPAVQVSMEMKAEKKERRATENGGLHGTGAREGRKCPPASPSSPMRNWYYCSRDKEDGKQRVHGRKGSSRRTETRKLLPTGDGFSSSSSLDCNDELGLFSDDGEEEEGSGALLSSKSFSSDSAEFYCSNRKATTTTTKKKSKSFKSTRRPPRRGDRGSSKPWALAARSPSTEKKTGFAVVKKNSRDPYMDFRSSMVEMIVDRGMSGASDMEDLLHSYLSLNSPLHHPVILEAFVDVWEAILAEQYM